MQNPIIQALKQNNQQMLGRLDVMRAILGKKDPEKLYQEMLKNNPQFKKFVEDNEGKSIEDIALAYDIDLSWLRH